MEHHLNREVSVLPSPALLLAAIAERTRTLRLGTAIVQLPLAHPLRMAEALDDVTRGWSADRFSFHGQFFRAEDMALAPRPVQHPHPPIHVAANGVDTAEWAGRAGFPIIVAAHVNRSRSCASWCHAIATRAPSVDRFARTTATVVATSVARAPASERPALEALLARVHATSYETVNTVSGIGASNLPASYGVPDETSRRDACSSCRQYCCSRSGLSHRSSRLQRTRRPWPSAPRRRP